MARRRQYELNGEVGSRKRSQSLIKALQGEQIEEGYDFTKHYGNRASFWPRLFIYGIASIALVTTLVMIYNSASTSLAKKDAESRFRRTHGIETILRLSESEIKQFYSELGLEQGTSPTKEDYERYASK